MAPQDALVKRDQVDGDNGSVFASFIIFLSIFILFLSYGVWRRRRLAQRQHALMVEWGLTGIDGLDDNTWPWWGRAQPRVELQAPKVFEAWVQSRNLSAEPEWNDLAPLSATFSRQPITSPAKLIPEERPTSPVILPENRSRMRQWLSFSATRPMPALPPPPPAAAPSPIQDVQIGVLLAMPFPPWKDKDSAKELEGLVMGFTRASWETPGSGDSEQKETTN